MKIDNGQIKFARREALKLMIGKGVCPEIVQLFKGAERKTFECESCKRLAMKKFLPAFLMYSSKQRLCKHCEEKVAKAYEAKIISEKISAMHKFKDSFQQLADSMINASGVPDVFKDASMKDIDPATVNVLSPHKSYFIKGAVGVGKSHMAVALMRSYLKTIKPDYDQRSKQYFIKDKAKHIPCFVEVPELLLRIRDTFNKNDGESEKDIVDIFSRTPYLVLDDLGSEKASGFSTLMLFLIINRRCTSRRTTIITSNLSLEEISERLSDRIGSRIKGMCKEISVSGYDKRYKQSTQ